MNVKLLPATVGVTLTALNTPAVNAADVPVIPAVPLYATVDVKLVAVLLFASSAVMVMPVIAVPAVCGDEIAEIAKWSTVPGLTVNALLLPAAKLSPLVRVAARITPLSALV
jgi:hypothetical protein